MQAVLRLQCCLQSRLCFFLEVEGFRGFSFKTGFFKIGSVGRVLA